jgi:hypothetical protein
MSRQVLLVLLLIVSRAYDGVAQTAASVHVFPQIVDGRLSDGSFYGSFVWVTNMTSGSTNCTITPYGLASSRFSSTTFALSAYSWTVIVTTTSNPLASGYARLNCSAPVTASLFYASTFANGVGTAGMATVSSAPSSSYALIPMLVVTGLRYAVALANDSDSSATVRVHFTNSSGQTTSQNISIPARSQYVRFVDEIFTIPRSETVAVGTFEVEATIGRFYLTGLMFADGTFTTVIPTTIP